MKKIEILLVLIVGLINCNNLFAQILPTWTTTYTCNYPATINENDMVADKSGNVYITGYIDDTSYSNYKVVTLKYNTYGQLQWIKEIDSLNYYTKIAIDDSGNVYIAGQSIYDLITVKYNSQGNLKWVKSYVGSLWCNWVFDIITDDSCNVYITGNSNGDRFTTVKYNVSGDLMWVALDGPAAGLTNSYIELDNNGNVYITARGMDTSWTCNTFKYNHSGIKQWERVYQGNFHPGLAYPRDLKFDPHGFIYMLACTTNNNDGEGDYAVVKYDTLGNQIWVSSYSFSSYYDLPKAMTIDKYGNVYTTGNIYPSGGTIDSIATIKFNKDGSFKWAKTYSLGYNNLDEASAITIDTLGYIYVVGKSSDYSSRENFVTIKYDSLGNEIWIARYKNTLNSSDIANSVSLDSYGNIYVSGSNYELNSSSILTIKYSNDVGVKEQSDDSEYIVNVLPNPFKTEFTLMTNTDLKNAELIIYDLFGKEVLKINNINNRMVSIQRGNLATGLYFFKLEEKNKFIAKGKIIAN